MCKYVQVGLLDSTVILSTVGILCGFGGEMMGGSALSACIKIYRKIDHRACNDQVHVCVILWESVWAHTCAISVQSPACVHIE